MRFNSDDGNNYHWIIHRNYMIGGNTYHESSKQVASAAINLYANARYEFLIEMTIRAKSGGSRLFMIDIEELTDANNYGWIQFTGRWTNTADEITTINLITGAITEGEYFLFRQKPA